MLVPVGSYQLPSAAAAAAAALDPGVEWKPVHGWGKPGAALAFPS